MKGNGAPEMDSQTQPGSAELARHLPRTGDIVIYQTTVTAWEPHVDESGLRVALHALLGHMLRRGHRVTRDPDTAKHYPSLSPGHWLTRKGELRATVTQSGRTLEVEFFQELNIVNQNGGRHDFQKFNLMPRTMQLQCIIEIAAVTRKLRALGYSHSKPALGAEPSLLELRDAICPPPTWGTLEGFNQKWNFASDWKRGVHRFERDESGWPSPKAIGRHLDRDGVLIRNGDVRYMRQRGRLARGVVHPNMNGMWSVGDFAYVSSGALFSCDPSVEPRRSLPGQQARLEAELQKAVTAQDYGRAEVLARVLGRPTQALAV